MATFDHCKSANDFVKNGIDVYASSGTIRAIGLNGHPNAHTVKHGVKFNVGDFEVIPFNLEHDADEPLGFFISGGGESLAFITDTGYCRYLMPKPVNVLMVEANFSDEILRDNVNAGHIDEARARRVRENHFSIERVVDLLRANDLSRLREVRLLHLSSGNSDEAMFKRMIQEVAGVPVIVEEE
jgi:phosphoribosyl 1,2-cyclic phosphodiesterase